MKAGKYTLNDFYSYRNFEQIIIPEIQRDYVWSDVQIKPFLSDLNNQYLEYKKKEQSIQVELNNNESKTLQDQFSEFILKQQYSYNVGFIYAYKDDEYPGFLFLIDGQQRFTTLFLLLLALAVKENKIEEFFKHYRLPNQTNRLDYRVRVSSSVFLNRFVKYVLDNGIDSLTEIENQYWYFSEYKQDETIKHILSAFNSIAANVKDASFEVSYQYLNHLVEFWYFDTNISEQGEELYIYMNARGEAVQDNENIKANLLSKVKLQTVTDTEKLKVEYGLEWEDWQNFFWQKRGVGKNADNGFNEFLRWLLIIKSAQKRKSEDSIYSNLLDGKLILTGIEDVLTIPEIKNYISAVKYLFIEFPEKAKKIEADYNAKFHSFNEMISSDWLERTKDSKSYSSFKKDNNEEVFYLNQINLFRLLPVLHFINLHRKSEIEIDDLCLYRLIRYFYNITRIDNVSKAVRESIKSGIEIANKLFNHSDKDIASIIDLSISKVLLTQEESNKFKLYKKTTDQSKRMEIENAFWHCEDFEYSMGTIHFVLKCTIDDIENIANGISDENINYFNRFNEIFQVLFRVPTDVLRRAILTFGDYKIWDGSTPYLGGQRYTFGHSKEQWIRILNHNEQFIPIQLLICKFIDDNLDLSDYETELERIINDYNEKILADTSLYNWKYEFTKDEKAFKYCFQKKICWVNDNVIWLLMNEKATENTCDQLQMTKIS